MVDSIPVWARVPEYRPSPTQTGHFLAAAMAENGSLVFGNPREAKLVFLAAGSEPKWIAIRDLAKNLAWTEREAGERYTDLYKGSMTTTLPGMDSISVTARYVGTPKPVIQGSRVFAIGADQCLWMVQSSAAGPRLTRYSLDGVERGSIPLPMEPTLVRRSAGGVVVAFSLNTGELRLTSYRGVITC